MDQFNKTNFDACFQLDRHSNWFKHQAHVKQVFLYWSFSLSGCLERMSLLPYTWMNLRQEKYKYRSRVVHGKVVVCKRCMKVSFYMNGPAFIIVWLAFLSFFELSKVLLHWRLEIGSMPFDRVRLFCKSFQLFSNIFQEKIELVERFFLGTF